MSSSLRCSGLLSQWWTKVELAHAAICQHNVVMQEEGRGPIVFEALKQQ